MKEAAFKPTYKEELAGLQVSLETAYNNAKEHGAFTYAMQMSRGPPDLYIRHEALFKEATQKLVKSAKDSTKQQRGLLIRGSWGMGKTTLARDVAMELSPQKPGGWYPTHVVSNTCIVQLATSFSEHDCRF